MEIITVLNSQASLPCTASTLVSDESCEIQYLAIYTEVTQSPFDIIYCVFCVI